jgi:protocatechuate 3,4-dioxygenase beta subunit
MSHRSDTVTTETNRRAFFLLLLVVFVLLPVGCREQPVARSGCQPTQYDEIGPFYRPNAPERRAVGKGYLLTGTVLSAGDCRPLARARIEFWLVNPQGTYDDDHRATVHADRQGRYRFESNRPTDYVGRKPHIHIMVSAAGHEQLITQHYPRENSEEGVFDLVLVPEPAR